MNSRYLLLTLVTLIGCGNQPATSDKDPLGKPPAPTQVTYQLGHTTTRETTGPFTVHVPLAGQKPTSNIMLHALPQPSTGEINFTRVSNVTIEGAVYPKTGYYSFTGSWAPFNNTTQEFQLTGKLYDASHKEVGTYTQGYTYTDDQDGPVVQAQVPGTLVFEGK